VNDRVEQHVDVDRLSDDRVEAGMHGALAVFGTGIAGARDRRCLPALIGW
jgi:hypothetical protein